jgi:hypothetical protein
VNLVVFISPIQSLLEIYRQSWQLYVQNASFWLDLRIAFYTLMFLFTGERRIERAVEEATLLQQTNGHGKIPHERKRVEVREMTSAGRPSSAQRPLSARGRTRPNSRWAD